MKREFEIDALKQNLGEAVIVINSYQWLIDAYVLDYYSENHWDLLPPSWRSFFDGLQDVSQLSDILLNLDGPPTFTQVLPLSLLTLIKCVRGLSASRTAPIEVTKPAQKSPLKHLYKQVKDKKCHEIDRMAGLTASTVKRCATNYVVDFGAGLGHLARILSFQHAIRVCCLEMQEKLSNEAKLIDERAIKLHQHLRLDDTGIVTPVHLNFKLTSETDCMELLEKIKAAFGIAPDDQSFSFGIVGLHPCGDLAIILTKFFLNCQNVRFLNIVGCCYMKLTSGVGNASFCHPVSSYLQTIFPSGLSYEAREIACHAIETYAERLKNNNYEYLKIHCYRALIERILIRHDPSLRRCGLKSVKQKEGLSFPEYARIVTENLPTVNVTNDELSDPQIVKDLAEWKKVVIVYTLRLFLAPLLETIVLHDRKLWILESDPNSNCILPPTFDPLKSPRNHVMIAERGPQ